MLPIVDASIQLGVEALKLLNTKLSLKFVNEVSSLKLEILEEEQKGDLCNDAKIENLEAKLLIAVEAAKSEIALTQR